MEITRYLLTPVIVSVLWAAGYISMGETLVPSPLSAISRAAGFFTDAASVNHLSLTLFRGITGLVITYFIALPAGIICGMNRRLMDGLSPLVTILQSCPPVIWISLLMVWAGMGNIVPVTVAVLTMLPVVFYSTASAVRAIDHDLFDLAHVYRVNKARIFTGMIFPAIYPPLVGSLSYSLGVAWKVIATAEFFGSADGIGSRLYWSFRFLDMTGLFAWTLVLILIGFIIEVFFIRNLRERYIPSQEVKR
jgi:ABC-type nitrate/sulfonate/bicarbonate transport system permease component